MNLYTTITKGVLQGLLLDQEWAVDGRTIGDLLESDRKKERVLGRRLLTLQVLHDHNPETIPDLLKREDWHEIRCYRNGNDFTIQIVRSWSQTQEIADQYEAARWSRYLKTSTA